MHKKSPEQGQCSGQGEENTAAEVIRRYIYHVLTRMLYAGKRKNPEKSMKI